MPRITAVAAPTSIDTPPTAHSPSDACEEGALRIAVVRRILDDFNDHPAERSGARYTGGYEFSIVDRALADIHDMLRAAASAEKR